MKKIFKFVILLFISTFIISFSLYKIPLSANDLDSIVISSSNTLPYDIQYNDNKIEIKKIISNIGLGYSLDRLKPYPHGETFKPDSLSNTGINNILSYGYPNKTAIELNLINNDDAYVATQLAIWSYLEGWDIEKININNLRLKNALNYIYYTSLSNTQNNHPINLNIYSCNKKIQSIILVSKN